MSRYYVLTVQQTKGKRCTFNYNRSLDRYETKYGVTIWPRYFEEGKIMKDLHVHCLVTQALEDPVIEDFIGQKNHDIDFELCENKAAWLNYIRKDQATARLV